MLATDPLVSSVGTLETKRSLILAGGGMRLAYQAGVLMALQESPFRFSHVDGTSGGIFNTAMLTSGLQAYEMAECWRALKMKWFVSMAPAKEYLRPLRMKGYTDADNIQKHVFPDLKIDLNKVRSNTAVNATFNVCNFSDKTIESISNRDVTEDHLIAGVSLPMVMPALKIGSSWYTDGVWIKDANLLESVRQQSEELWLVWAIGNCASYLPGALNQYVHMIEMSANGALLEEYKQIAKINESILGSRGEYAQRKPVKLFVIKPEFPLPLDPDLFYNKIDTRALINIGYSDGKRCLASGTQEGTPMDKGATMMTEPGLRLNFAGTFQGKLNWFDTSVRVSLYAYFSIHRIAGQLVPRLFSSLNVSKFPGEICIYDHQIHSARNGSQLVLTTEAKFLHDGEKYDIRMVWKLRSPIDLLIGLEFKRVEISVSLNGASVMKGNLYQSLRNRLRGLYTTNVRTEEGGAGGIGKRYDIMKQLIAHGI